MALFTSFTILAKHYLPVIGALYFYGGIVSKTWSLEDVTLIAKEAPYTFYLPSKSVINQLQVGSVVKLMFNCNVENEQGWSAERMWVIITEVNDGYYKGTLDNDPSYIPDIKYQDIVEFESKHIMQTDIEESESDIVEKYNPRCYVTSHVLKDGFLSANYIERNQKKTKTITVVGLCFLV